MISLPGETSQVDKIARMIRVNHAGEFGASRIYEGQLDVLKNTESGFLIEEMKSQEQIHLEAFDQLIRTRQIRPTIFSPLWSKAGYLLGFLTAKLGVEAAMACTVAVEEVIDEHYEYQLNELKRVCPEEIQLHDLIHQFRQDEQEHGMIGIDYGALDAPAYKYLRGAIRTASKAAIWISTRF